MPPVIRSTRAMPRASRRTTAAVSTGKLDTPASDEHAALPRRSVELRDALHEIRAVGEIEIVDAARDRGAHHPIGIAIGLERPARVHHDVGRQRGQLRLDVAFAVERRRDQRRASRARARRRPSACAGERPAMTSVSRASSASSRASRPPNVP